MNVDQANDLVRESLLVALQLSAPILGVGLVIGLIISMLQAVTQIQEQTLSFVPKIVGMALATIFILPWLSQRLIEFTQRMLGH